MAAAQPARLRQLATTSTVRAACGALLRAPRPPAPRVAPEQSEARVRRRQPDGRTRRRGGRWRRRTWRPLGPTDTRRRGPRSPAAAGIVLCTVARLCRAAGARARRVARERAWRRGRRRERRRRAARGVAAARGVGRAWAHGYARAATGTRRAGGGLPASALLRARQRGGTALAARQVSLQRQPAGEVTAYATYGCSLKCYIRLQPQMRRVAASNMGLQVAIDLWVHGVADHVALQVRPAVPGATARYPAWHLRLDRLAPGARSPGPGRATHSRRAAESLRAQ